MFSRRTEGPRVPVLKNDIGPYSGLGIEGVSGGRGDRARNADFCASPLLPVAASPPRFRMTLPGNSDQIALNFIGKKLKRLISGFTGADANHLLQIGNKDFPVTNLSGSSRPQNRVDDLLGLVIGHDNLHFGLR